MNLCRRNNRRHYFLKKVELYSIFLFQFYLKYDILISNLNEEVDMMSVTISLGAWRSVFAVPSKIVDEGLKFSDGVKLKVLLYVLRNADRELDNKDISACTGVNVTDIPEALEYWVNMGILKKTDQTYMPVDPIF